MKISLTWSSFGTLLFLLGCATREPLPLANNVDVRSFMGAWYVMGYTPIVVDKDAYNAVEHYAQADDGRILTTYQFRKGGFDGPLKTYTPTGFIPDPDRPAEWRMQFIWPFKGAYRIFFLSDDGEETIIAHPNRKYAWIMTRSPTMDDSAYLALVNRLVESGFDAQRIQRVPHDWTAESERMNAIERAGATTPLAPR